MRPTGQTVAVLGGAAKDAQADAAHEADVDDVPVAEAGGAEVDGDAGREDEVRAGGGGGEEGGHEVGEEAGGGGGWD